MEANITQKVITGGDRKAAVEAPQRRVGLRAFVGTFGSSGVILCIEILQGIVLARLLGPAGRGQFAAIILWPTVFTYIGLLGTHMSVGRLAAKEDDIGSIFRSSVQLALFTSLITVLAGYFLLPVLIPKEQHSELLALSRIYLLFIPAAQLISNLAAIDQGRGDFFRLNIIRVLRGPFYLLCLIIIYFSGSKLLFWFVLASLLTEVSVAVSRFVWVAHDYAIIGWRYSLNKILRGGFQFGLVEIGQQIYTYIDKILLLWLVDSKNMGLYVAGLSASMVLRVGTTSMGTVAFTITAQSQDRQGFERVGHLFRKAVILQLLIGICFVFSMPLLIRIVYGREFLEAVNPAIVLLIGSSFAGLAYLLDQCMRGQGKPFAGLIGRISAIIIMFLTEALFTKLWGLIGITAAFGIAQFVYVFTLMFEVVLHYQDARMLDFVPGYKDILDLMNIALRCVAHLKAKVFKDYRSNG